MFLQGPVTVATIDPGPPVPTMAGEGTIRPGPAARSSDLGAADQQAGGAVEGQPRGEARGSGEARGG